MAEYVITVYRSSAPPDEFCEAENPAGDWYWNLDDGLLPVGPYLTEEGARSAALKAIADNRALNG